MKAIAINTCYGGFGLSDEAIELYLTKSGKVPFYKLCCGSVESIYASHPFDDTGVCSGTGEYYSQYDLDRDDPILIEVIEQLGKAANGQCADLKIVRIPDDILYDITYYDGKETIRERSRNWS